MEEADRFLTRLTTVLRDLFKRVQELIPLSELQEKLKEHTAAEVLKFLDIENRFQQVAFGAGVAENKRSLTEALREIFAAGAHAEITQLGKVPVRKQTVGADMAFDLMNQRAVNFLDGYVFNLIKGISNQSKLAIQDVLVKAFRQGGNPYDQARLIRDSIGLTQAQALAVQNYRDMLESGVPSQMQAAVDRALASGKWDRSVASAIANNKALPQDMIDRMVSAYASRSLNYRAEMIARTETSRASNAGQQEAWDQAVDQGLLDPKTTLKVWIAAEDCCDDCGDVADADGVPIDDMFDTSDGPLDGPPLHPNCRCGMSLEFSEDANA